MNHHRSLIIGGSGALGSAICELLLREGAKVAFTFSKNQKRADQLAEKGAHPFSFDLRELSSARPLLKNTVEELGGLDSLILASGISGREIFYHSSGNQFEELEEQDLSEIIDINTKGPFALCQAVWPHLKKQGGNIVLIGSMDGIKAVPSPIHFATSKAALKGMVESMSKKLGSHKICINLVAPGILDGGASSKLSEETKKEYLKHCSLERFGTMEEVAEVVVWLAVENTYLTGQAILLDGGL